MKEDPSMLRTLFSTGLALTLALAPVTARGRVVDPQAAQAAQAAQPAQAPKAEQPQPERRRTSILEGQPVNVRIEITITDQQPGSAPIQKTVTLVLADRTRGMVRSESNQVGIGSVPLRADARVSVVDSGQGPRGDRDRLQPAGPGGRRRRARHAAHAEREHQGDAGPRAAQHDPPERQAARRVGVRRPDHGPQGEGGGEGDDPAIERMTTECHGMPTETPRNAKGR